MRSIGMHKQRGVSLIEVQVAMIILATGILAMAALQLRTLAQTMDQHNRQLAIWQAQAIIDRISINNSEAAVAQYLTSINDNELCDVEPVRRCAESYDEDTGIELVAQECTDTQLAIYDSWELICHSTNSATNLDDFSIRNNLDINTLSLTCADDPEPCDTGSNLTLSIRWLSKVASSDSRLTEDTIVTDEDGEDEGMSARLENYRVVFIP